jgi:hypothetical protein
LRWLQSRIPPVSATELGFFRFVFGLGVAWVVYELRLPEEPYPIALHLRAHRLADWEWVHALAARPDLVVMLETCILAAAIVFAVGLFTRVTFTILVAAVTVWTLVRLTHTGVHNWSALFVALWALLPVRWGEGFSLDALVGRILRRRRPPRPLTAPAGLGAGHDIRRAEYGYALWVPGLVFGTAMAGAGVAKLTQSGLAWITNGSVKYHFVVDARSAPTDWGLWVASHPNVAVLMSAGAIVIECGLILAVLVPSWLGRLPFAVMAAALLIGFYVFQGELWSAWWLLCLAFFVPWPAMVRTFSGPREKSATVVMRAISPAQLVAIVVVCALQLTASVWRFEVSPIMSDYPMYATMYASVAEFEKRESIPPVFHFAVRFDDGVETDASELFDRLGLDGPVRDAYRATVEHTPEAARAAAVVSEAREQLTRHFGRPVTAITVLVDQRAFDWNKGRFYWKHIRKPVYTFETP